MKRSLFLTRCSLFPIAIVFTLIIAYPAQATWNWVHGNSGHIEYKDRFFDTNAFEKGWGLDFELYLGYENYVHFSIPVPTVATKGVRYIRLNFSTGSGDAFVSNIIVYDGTTLVKEKPGIWSYSNRTVTVDLGSVRSFTRGLGITARVEAGQIESVSHRFIFIGAGANIQDK